MLSRITCIFSFCILFASFVLGQSPVNRYALILEDPPVVSKMTSREAAQSVEANTYRQQVEARQRAVRNELNNRKIQITASVSTVLNAVFVIAPKDRVDELKNIPGVMAVVQLRWRHLNLNQATQLVNAPAAWNTLGGVQNAGNGMKIGIMDTGIDNNHPAFRDTSLPIPAGFPICSGSDCAFTNNKVIVARSYVRQLAMGSNANNPAADSRPDDYSPRDRVGHGTATASCAAAATNTGLVTFSGMAPKAYLGNYKITGSPEVNDNGVPEDVIISALDDAFNDGMNVVSFSFGGPAFTGPLDSGAACGNPAGVACDLVAKTFNDVAQKGLILVAAGGNDGTGSLSYPNFNSIESPGNAPAVIAAGASTNSHVFAPEVIVPGPGVPSNLQSITAQPSDFSTVGATTAPLRDAAQVGDGLACSALPAGSLTGTIALIERGSCTFTAKTDNAANAGAIGAIFYMADASTTISPGGLDLPGVMISNADGVALKSFIDANPDHVVTIDPNAIEQSAQANLLASFSSVGPSIDGSIKPDLVAPGQGIYMAAQSYDPLGEIYSSTGYLSADGTSFATPIIAGAAALVKQAHPTFTSAQVKSALVNTASQDVTSDDQSNSVGIQSVGAGRLDTNAAVTDTTTVNPTSLSFGILTSDALPKTQQLQVTNSGSGTVNLSIAIAAAKQSTGASLALDKNSLSLNPGATGTVNVMLSGSIPSPGAYSGTVTIQGSGVSLRVPYLYLVGDGVAANLFPMTGDLNGGTVGQQIPDGILSFKLTDQYGVPVAGAAVSWSAQSGASVQNASSTTDANGIATAEAFLGSQAGSYTFTATAPRRLKYTFTDFARLVPNIPASGGIANAASFDTASPIAPGSYITIGGSNLSDLTDSATTTILPLAIDFVNVSFDVPSAGISVPGYLTFVSPNQVNLQVPWELQNAIAKGQTSAQVKVTIDNTVGNLVTVLLGSYSPAFFEGTPGAVAALDQNFHVINAGHPAVRGQAVQLYANGLGPVTNTPASGDPATSSSLAATTTVPTVTIGGVPAPVSFSGLAPGFPGLYQVNVTVPTGLAAGNQSLVLTIGGKTSKTSGIVVQ